MTDEKTSRDLIKMGGIALIAGSLINVLRVAPVLMSDGVNAESFPPHSADQIIFASQLGATTPTHVVALLGTALLVFGSMVLARSTASGRGATAGMLAQVGITLSMALLSIALVTDGVVLPTLIDRLAEDGVAAVSENGALIIATHLMATTMAGVGAMVLLVTAILLGMTLLRAFGAMILGWVGIVIGTVGCVGYATGVISLDIAATPQLTGPLIMLMFLYLSAIGVTLLRASPEVA